MKNRVFGTEAAPVRLGVRVLVLEIDSSIYIELGFSLLR
jgi:hypothetical protein